MYNRTTRNIRIHVQPQFLESQSRPDEAKFVWAYTITIENQGAETVTLLSRYWKITDAFGRVQEVRGDGVVGEQPTLKPGENFEYTSGARLPRPPASWSAATRWKTSMAKTSRSLFPPSRSTAPMASTA